MATYIGEMQKLVIGDKEYSLPSSGGSGTVTSVGLTNATNGGLTISGSPITGSGSITVGHSNVLTSAQTTQAVYPIKIDKNGHISAYGSSLITVDSEGAHFSEDINADAFNGNSINSPLHWVGDSNGGVNCTYNNSMLSIDKKYAVNGYNLFTEVNQTVSWTGSIASGSTHDFEATYNFPTGYSRVIGCRGIRTNHETAMGVTAWSISYTSTTYTVYARCRAFSAISSNANTCTFYILLGAQ